MYVYFRLYYLYILYNIYDIYYKSCSKRLRTRLSSKLSSLPRIYDKFQPQDSMIFSGDYVVKCRCRKEELIGAVGAAELESQWM